VEFLRVGNHPGVDLCNTCPIVDGEPVELLATPPDLGAWLAVALGQAPASRVEPDRSTLLWARRLREDLRAVLTSGGARTDALDGLNATLAALAAAPAVDGTGQLMLRSPRPQVQLRLELARLAIDACGLDPDRVRRCANPECVLLFYDTTRSGTRRWHDMASCGNRAKAAAHYERTRRSGRRPA
jgi:predicted RNA-binding Zn ribbon-like protein